MAHVLACNRVPVKTLVKFDEDGNFLDGLLPKKWIDLANQNQQRELCCRHPENHDIEAFYSNEEERWRGKNPDKDIPNPPDVYIFYCSCGKKHRTFGVGEGGRPFWESH